MSDVQGSTYGVREEQLRKELVHYSHLVHARGWVANHDGNLSGRLAADRIVATPTAVSKGDVQAEWLIVVNGEGQVVEGTRKAFSELALHRAAYAARPDIGAVIHAHPPTATGFAVAGVELGHPFMSEPVVSLGPRIPTVSQAGLGDALRDADVCILDRHGVIAVGGTLEQAYLRLELVEHLARIALVARQLGGVRPLEDKEVASLAQKGRPASAAPMGPAPTAHPDVASVVAEALQKHR